MSTGAPIGTSTGTLPVVVATGVEPGVATGVRPGVQPCGSDRVVTPMRWWDLDDVRAVEVPSFGPDAWTRESFLSELSQDGRIYHVLRDGHGSLLGYVGVVVHGTDAELQTVAVSPAARGAGLGRRLLGVAADGARAAGARRLDLEVREQDPVAVGLYLTAGFRRQGRRPGYYCPAEPGGERVAALLMRLDLPAGPLA